MPNFLSKIKDHLTRRPLPVDTKQRIAAMADELRRGGPLYLPSKFWTNLNSVNEAQLAAEGFENFKRTVNQNYFNWGPNSFGDNQLRNLLRLWVVNPGAEPVLAAMSGDHKLINMFNQDMLDTPDKARIYVFFVGLLWWYAMQEDAGGLTSRLSEPDLGNPLEIRLGTRRISQDLANSIRERNTVCKFVRAASDRPQVVAEIGAGYGRLAYAFVAASNWKYMIFDVPPALYISERYLQAVLPGKKQFRFRRFERFSDIEAELRAADIGFFTANQIEHFPEGYFDISVSVSALHEMRADQIANYLSKMDALTAKTVYLKNWRTWHNTEDDVRIDESTFRLSSAWQVALERVDVVQDMFAEKVFVRAT